MRGPAHPPFTEVPHEVRFSTRQVRHLDSATVFSLPDSQCPRCPGDTIAGVSCHGVHVAPSEIHVEGADLPQEGVFHQSFVACTSKELQNAFSDYWNQLWRRDIGPASQSTDAWPDFVALLQEHGVPSAQLDLDPFEPETLVQSHQADAQGQGYRRLWVGSHRSQVAPPGRRCSPVFHFSTGD